MCINIGAPTAAPLPLKGIPTLLKEIPTKAVACVSIYNSVSNSKNLVSLVQCNQLLIIGEPRLGVQVVQ